MLLWCVCYVFYIYCWIFDLEWMFLRGEEYKTQLNSNVEILKSWQNLYWNLKYRDQKFYDGNNGFLQKNFKYFENVLKKCVFLEISSLVAKSPYSAFEGVCSSPPISIAQYENGKRFSPFLGRGELMKIFYDFSLKPPLNPCKFMISLLVWRFLAQNF